MKLKPKMRAARQTLNRILDSHERQQRQGAAAKNHPFCVVRGDAITFGCESADLEALRTNPDFHRYFDGFVRRRKPDAFLAYKRISRFRCTTSGSKFWVYYQRQASHLPEFRIEFFPEDNRGLRRREVASILELTTKPKIIRMEVAFDFGPSASVDNDFVRRSLISGKCQPHSVHEQIYGDAWGSRKGAIFIRSYFKKAIGAHRVELQLNPRFLRRHGIHYIFQFHRLLKLIPIRHFYFARINYEKLIVRLRANGNSVEDVLRILDAVGAREWHLCGALNYLRRRLELQNVRRFLIPLEINEIAREALKKWARKWPKKPKSMGKGQ